MLALLLACSEVDPDYVSERAAAICARHARCGTLEQAGFVDEETCRDALDDNARAMRRREGLECAAWNGVEAEACLEAYEGSCDALDLSACEAVCG